MNEFIFLSLENIDDILTFSRVCKKGNDIYKKWKDEWYNLHTQIVKNNEFGYKIEIKIIGNRTYITTWYENGKKKEEGEYKDRELEGKWTMWWENGNKSYEGEYKNGKREGKWFGWGIDGTLQYGEEYKDGKFKCVA